MDNYNKLKDSTQNKARDLYEDAKEDTKSMYEEGSEKASATYNAVKERAESVGHSIEDTARDLYKDGKKKVNDLNDGVCDYTGELLKHVQRKPLTSLLIAGGLAYIIASITKK